MLKIFITALLLTGLGLVQANKEKTVAGGALCQLCTTVMTEAQQLVSQNSTEEEVAQFIDNTLCNHLGPLKDTCSQYVDKYAKILFAELSQKLDPSIICHSLGLCAVEKAPKLKSLKPIDSSLNCAVCKITLNQALNLIKSNATEQQIIGFIEKELCGALGPLEKICIATIDNFGPTIIQYLVNGVDPAKVCQVIGLCPKTTIVKRDVSSFIKKEIQPKAQDTLYCTVCQYAVQYIDAQIQNNKTEAAIVAALENVCKVAPAQLRNVCETLIESSGDYIVQLLVNFADPKKVCQALKLCTAQEKIEMESMEIVEESVEVIQEPEEAVDEPIYENREPKAQDTLYCTVCQYAVQYIDAQIQSNKSEAAIVAALENVCNVVPSQLRNQCESLIETYGNYLVELLVNFADPKKVCQALKLCTASESSLLEEVIPKMMAQPEEPVQEKAQDTLYCTVCQYAVQYIDAQIQNNKTEAAIVAALESVCKVAPAQLRNVCETLIESSGDYIVQLLVNFADPKKVCQALKLCTAQGKIEMESMEIAEESVEVFDEPIIEEKAQDNLYCTICKYAVQYIDAQIQNNKTEAAIVSALESVCKVAPAQLRGACETLIESYGDYIIQLLVNLVDPTKVCQALKLCTAKISLSDILMPIKEYPVPFVPEVEKKAEKSNPLFCTGCQYVMQFLDNELESDKSEAAIEKALEEVCRIAPSQLRSQCENIIDSYGKYLVQLLIQFADPLKVCQAIKLC